jgi:hypothetical protein
MKKTLIIAMCCITVLFASCKKEKPYEKFIGSYEGDALLKGTVSVSMGGTSLNKDLENPVPMVVSLTAGDADNKLVMTYTPEDQDETYTVIGTITDDQVAFDPVQIEQEIEGSTVKLTIDMDGVLAGTIFVLNGTFTGNGNITILDLPTPVPFTASGTISANLNKLIEE